MIDWDLRSGLTDPVGVESCYKLKPSLRVIDMTEHGSIAGTVDSTLIDAEGCTADVTTLAGNVVYIYEGDVVPDDIDANDPDPITTTNVTFNEVDGYRYQAAFLSPGTYTAAFTCQGQDDEIPDDANPELDTDEEIVFVGAATVEVVDGQEATVDFVAE